MTTDETLVHHFQPEVKSELWQGSLPYMTAKTVMSADKGDCIYFVGCNRSTAVGLLGKSHTISRASINKKGALQPKHCPCTHIHSVQAWLLGVFQLLKHILDEAVIDVDHFLTAQDGVFYIENLHLLLYQWSKCVLEGEDCVVIWKTIVLFSKTNTKFSCSMFQEE